MCSLGYAFHNDNGIKQLSNRNSPNVHDIMRLQELHSLVYLSLYFVLCFAQCPLNIIEAAWISGQNANTQNPNTKKCSPQPQNPNPQTQNQWHFIHWCFVRDIMTGYRLHVNDVDEICDYVADLSLCAKRNGWEPT